MTSLLVNSALTFVLALISIIVVGGLARYVATAFTTERASRVTGFGVAIGYALGRFTNVHAARIEDLPAISAPLGALAGVAAVWAWLLRKRSTDVNDVDC